MKINKKLLITVVILLALSIVIFLIISNKNNTTISTDNGGLATSGVYDTNGKLQYYTTDEDYYVIQERLKEYILTKSNKSVKIEVTNVQSQEREGTTLSFSINVADLGIENKEVIIDFNPNPNESFMVPSENYKVPLYGGQS